MKVFLFLSLWLPLAGIADTPFAGSWVLQPRLTEYSLRPLSFMIDRGTYKRTSCVPASEVPTDGMDHEIPGDPFADTMSVRLPDASRAEVVQKRSEKLTWKGYYTVAKDHQSMILKYEDHRPANTVSGSIRFQREGDVVTHAHFLSGTWQPLELLDLLPTSFTVTIVDSDNGLTLNASDGRSFTIKFDRKDYPVDGYLTGAAVQVGRRAARTLQVNSKQNRAFVEMSIATVADDDRTLKWNQIDEQCQSRVIWTLLKQPAP